MRLRAGLRAALGERRDRVHEQVRSGVLPSARVGGTAAAVGLVAGLAVLGSALAPAALPGAAGRVALTAAGALPAPGGSAAPAVDASTVAAPVSLTVPAAGVDAPLVSLGLTADGELAVPEDAAEPGWFTGSAVPGAPGPSVVAGHVDSLDGPGVFIRLERLAPGDEVVVGREDGSSARFVVTGTLQTAKDEFPTAAVYGPTAVPELRLITCDGAFDEDTGHYRDNLVVFARLAA